MGRGCGNGKGTIFVRLNNLAKRLRNSRQISLVLAKWVSPGYSELVVNDCAAPGMLGGCNI